MTDATSGPATPAGPISLDPGLEWEVAADFLDADALQTAPRRLYRYNGIGGRFYYTLDDDFNPRLYPSVTAIIKATTPTPQPLIDWMLKNGKDDAERIRDERASYGTSMHALFADYLLTGAMDLGEVRDILEGKKLECRKEWLSDLRQDLIGFTDFVDKWEVEPLAIELALASDSMGYAGTLDLAAKVKGKVAYVDFKSNRKFFSEENKVQGHAYKLLWNEIYPHIPMVRTMLYGAKDWRAGSRETTDRFRLEDTTDEKVWNEKKWLKLLDIFDPHNHTMPQITEYSGKLTRGGKRDANVRKVTVAELIKRRHAPGA